MFVLVGSYKVWPREQGARQYFAYTISNRIDSFAFNARPVHPGVVAVVVGGAGGGGGGETLMVRVHTSDRAVPNR